MLETDVIVIGGGAAGLFCAIEAGRRGRRVLVLEHNGQVGRKIAISGGGRCNFTNLYTTAENFISANPHFAKSALARYTPSDFIALVEKHGIGYHEKKLGQLFCDKSSRQIIEMLLKEGIESGARILCQCEVLKVSKEQGLFRLETNQGSFISSSLVIATGGLSIPSLGATDFAYRVARQFGLKIESLRPGLVPFTLAEDVRRQLAPLSGVSLDSVVSCCEKEFRENILITHRGLSGPAVLQISSYWRQGEPVNINMLPAEDFLLVLERNRNSAQELATLLAKYLPKRFAQRWCELYADSRPLKQYNQRELSQIASKVHQMQLRPNGTEGFKKAEVTAGGVSTSELSSQTMEALRVEGLYFIGEAVDVTGHLGGYNFQWAWASAHAAGQHA